MMQEEIQQQKEKLKNMSRWERFKYFWFYNKIKVLLTTIVVLAVIFLVKNIYNNRFDEYINVALVNCNIVSEGQTTLISDYVKSRNVDESHGKAAINVNLSMKKDRIDSLSLANSQSLQAFMENGDYDILIADDWVIDDFASQALLCDLSTTLPSDLLEIAKDHLYYYNYPDGTRVPVGFYADNLAKVSVSYKETVKPIVAIPAKTIKKDISNDFIRYLYE